MTLEEVLKAELYQVRLVSDDHRLVYDNKLWQVYRSGWDSRRNTLLLETEDLSEALEKFTEGWEVEHGEGK
jgi:hypothetical protein